MLDHVVLDWLNYELECSAISVLHREFTTEWRVDAMRRIDLESLPWDQPAEDVRSKSVSQHDYQIRLVQFAPGFSEIEWCSKAHVGYVVMGQLEVTFADGIELFMPGDALAIAAGDRHRARVVEGPVRLFLVE